jgi:coenzyme F420-0:L-glutamate ligase/coenzyme F420-1:gamma-L-glutamate ligase
VDTAAILPVKSFSAAKQRLAATLAEQRRRDLAGAMVADVLDALAETDAISLTIIVTSQPELLRAGAPGTLVLEDTAEAGQSAAVSLGIARALAEGYGRVLCVPGDCPALDPDELQQLLAAEGAGDAAGGAQNTAARHRPAEVVAIPDRHGSGTNGLLLSPPDAITPSFGPDSFARHRSLALAAGASWRVARPPSLLLDIDTGDDLAALRERLAASDGGARRTRAALARADLAGRHERAGPRPGGVLSPTLRIRSLPGIPEVRHGDDLALLVAEALVGSAVSDGDVLAVAHKVVSKAEGALRPLADVTPSERAVELAAEAGKDPRAVQVVLDESIEILRAERGVLICRTRHGLVCANAGVDASNAPDRDTVIVLPRDPDGSARELRARLRELTGASVAVIITDSFGRAWRHGQLDVAIGLAGLAPLDDWRGRTDSAGLELQATWLAIADAAAAAADLVRAKDSGEPLALISGLDRFVSEEDGPGAAALMRGLEEDLFR